MGRPTRDFGDSDWDQSMPDDEPISEYEMAELDRPLNELFEGGSATHQSRVVWVVWAPFDSRCSVAAALRRALSRLCKLLRKNVRATASLKSLSRN